MGPFYTGDNCDILCNNRGTPDKYNMCKCDKGFSGWKCETECNGNGTFKQNTGKCDCYIGYKGDYCQTPI